MYIITLYSEQKLELNVCQKIIPDNYYFDQERNTHTFYIKRYYKNFLVGLARRLRENTFKFSVVCDGSLRYIIYVGRYCEGYLMSQNAPNVQYHPRHNFYIEKIRRIPTCCDYSTDYTSIWGYFTYSGHHICDPIWY